MALISEATPLKGHRIKVKLANGKIIYVDFSDKLSTCRFCSLVDENTFSDVSTDGLFIIWNRCNVKISASELCLAAAN